MSVKIQIQNFQSIHNAEIVVDGFTVVTGANNSGKTAAMRAVQSVFSNPPISAFLRDGEDKLNVKMTFDGHVLEWEKGNKVKPTYTVDGKVFHPGREIPPAVIDLGVCPIQAGGASLWPQIAPQFTGVVFLLDQSGAVVAEAVTDAERVGKLNQALKLAESDRRSYAAELKLRTKDISLAEIEVSKYQGVDTAVSMVDDVEQIYKQLRKVQDAVALFKGLQQQIQTCRDTLQKLAWVDSFSMPKTPDIKDVLFQIADYTSIMSRRNIAMNHVASLAWVDSATIPAKPEIDLVSLREMKQLSTQMQATKALCQKLRIPDVQFSDTSKASKILELHTKLSTLQRDISSVTTSQHVAEQEIASCQKQLDAVMSEIQSYLATLGRCPTCGGDTHA